jgi:hypothetical protein
MADDFLIQAFKSFFNVKFITNWKSVKRDIENNQDFINTQELGQPLNKIMEHLCKAPYISKIRFVSHKLHFGFEVGAWFIIETNDFMLHYALDYDTSKMEETESLTYSINGSDEKITVPFSKKNLNKIIKLFYDYQNNAK